MATQSPLHFSPVWPPNNPHRQEFATIIGHRLVLATGIVVAILFIWGSATSPRSAGFGTDMTTAIPDRVVDNSAPSTASTATYTPRKSP